MRLNGVERNGEYYNFTTKEAAIFWMLGDSHVGGKLEFVDNIRFSFLYDSYGMSEYRKIADNGCCGFFDQLIRIKGRKAYVGV